MIERGGKKMSLEFPTSISEAKLFQERVSRNVILSDCFSNCSIIASFDIAYKSDTAFAAGVIYDTESETVIEEKTVDGKVEFPYIPGYLFLREVPHFLTLFNKIENIPDIIIIDGHGIAHPRTSGSATVFGLLSDIPSIGVAKKPMKYFEYKETSKNYLDKIYLQNHFVGFRHKFEKKWNPIFISPGHKISIKTSYELIQKLLSSKFKLPLPQHYAHLLAAKFKDSFFH